jgi:dienelactone hydrolase
LLLAIVVLLDSCVTPAAGPIAPQPRPVPDDGRAEVVRGATHVAFPSRDGDLTADHSPTTIDGYLMLPDGAGPHPAVILLHGCGGLFAHRGDLTARHRDWAERLVAQGYVVLLPDSFGPRHVDEICSNDKPTVRPGHERARDVYGAMEFLATRAEVDASRIALLGWSNGGSTVLEAIAARTRARPAGLAHDARVAIAFYPGCKHVLANTNWLPPAVPLHVLIGAADDWTPAAPCVELVDHASAAGGVVDLVVYPGAYHDFDDPDTAIHVRQNIATTASHVATVGTNPAARADAIARVTAWLHDAFQ